jgi:hypothetical protein
MDAKLRTKVFVMQGWIAAWPIVSQSGPALSRFLSKHPFTSARIIAAHFEVAYDSMNMIFARELDLKEFSRRWLPRQLSDAQKQW